ncbi:hypothetical protein IW138_003235 [Coemansia sp. RSA 986]|nr:hypothetical protein IW138_003235 [Coemansia sp. RSA 986]
MKAVSNLRTRMKHLGDASPSSGEGGADGNSGSGSGSSSSNNNNNSNSNNRMAEQGDKSSSSLGFRRRQRTSSGPAHLTTPATGQAAATPSPAARRPWAVLPRKLRGLHPAPAIIYVRENPQAVAHVLDTLYESLVGTYNVDSKDIRVTNVPTAFDLPSAVRRIGRSKQVVIIVGTLSRDKPWHDEGQLSAVRKFLLHWSQSTPLPLVDGLVVADTQQELLHRVCERAWDVRAADDFDMVDDQDENDEEREDDEKGAGADGYLFGNYLAHRAIEMFYFEQRGW